MPTGVTRALVFGGSGAVGSEVVRGLAARGIETVHTYLRHGEEARSLPGRACEVDLRNVAATRDFVGGLLREGFDPQLFVHCAAVTHTLPLGAIEETQWQEVLAVNVVAPLVACQTLQSAFARAGEAHVVLVGAMDRGQALPLPAHFSASQGALAALTLALAKELGPAGTRVNMMALGPLDAGLSSQLSPDLLADYRSFSALQRVGTPSEAAKAILWLALENTYVTGKVIPVNGGI